MLLGTAAEMFANALQRWQTEAAHQRQINYEEALSRCSHILHQLTLSEEEQIVVFNQALEQMRLAVDAGRAYLFENFVDPELGLCTGMGAEVCAPGVHRLAGSVQLVSWLLPATYGTFLLQDVMLRGLPVNPLVLIGLVVYGIILFTFSWWRLRRKMASV